ncbi:hypothetical protein F4802DRAFT_53566 [Xylaria palmicola]|nr:hypothetical protein F4802DRAFT_53566 [Xylaria palmicola]
MSGEDDDQAPRPSRYRSLRKMSVSANAPSTAQRADSDKHEPDQRHDRATTNSISRSMSRYRRRAASVTAGTDNNAAVTMGSGVTTAPPVPAIPSLLKTESTPATASTQTESMPKSPPQHRLRRADIHRQAAGQKADERDQDTNATRDSKRRQPVVAGPDNQHGSPEMRNPSWDAERDRLLEEQKRKDLQRLEEQLESVQSAKPQSHRFRSQTVEKLVLLAKGNRNSKDGMSPASPMTASARSSVQNSGSEHVKTLPAHIEPGGKGIVPQKDAPASAINAGDRNVTVRCRHHTFSLPVTPETTTVDLIAQASGALSHNVDINPGRCAVVEQYTVLGLERRLRHYEHIRDVMNSWERDAQNQLAIVLLDQDDSHVNLNIDAVPESKDAPSGFQLYMYHSNRPGKWNKRWITLFENGQIACAKKPNAKMTDKDTANLCHLSDYDIYTPTESHMRRHIKPPKLFCFAIKSQHKTTLFLNTENYVQYFSTEDSTVASEFREKAHGWRSWYLVDRNPDARKKQPRSGAKAEKEPPALPLIAAAPKKHESSHSDEHHPQLSIDDAPYPIGKFEPLIDMKRFDKRLSQFGEDTLPRESDSTSKQIPEPSVRRRLSKREKPGREHRQATKRESQDGFTGGLLAEEYNNRKQALAELEKKKRPLELAFTDGPSLLNTQLASEAPIEHPVSPPWFPSAIEHTAKQRSHPATTDVEPTASAGDRSYSLNATTHRPIGLHSSAIRPSTQHAPPHSSLHTNSQRHAHASGSQPTEPSHVERRLPHKPLVDLTPAFQEPPQWLHQKRGHGVKPPEGFGHLINLISPSNGMDNTPTGHLASPPHRMAHRPTTSGSSSLGRTRSMSSATSPRRPLLDEAPPIPLLPAGLGHENNSNSRRLAGAPVASGNGVVRRDTVKHSPREQDTERLRERGRERRDRDYRERGAAYNAVPGRTGTLRVV